MAYPNRIHKEINIFVVVVVVVDKNIQILTTKKTLSAILPMLLRVAEPDFGQPAIGGPCRIITWSKKPERCEMLQPKLC